MAEEKGKIMPRPRPFPPTTYAMWRIYVLERDNFICQWCGLPANHAHHVKSYINHPKLQLDVANGTSLCSKCHRKTPTERNHASQEY